jgi:hypothetical protein
LLAQLFLAVLALCIGASSVSAQPEPRVVSRESIAAAPGYKFDPYSKLALAPDGSGYVLMASISREKKPFAIVELVRIDRNGKAAARQVVATRSDEYFAALASTHLHVLPSGEVLIVTTDREIAGTSGHLGGLVRLTAEGKVLNRAPFHYPHDVPASDRNADYHHEISKVVSTAGNTVVLGGSYGPGPSGWWWGKFTVNGARLAEQTSKVYFPMRVDALSATPGGGFRMVFRDYNKAGTSDIVFQHHSATGDCLSRVMLFEKSESHGATFTSDGRIVVVKTGDPGRILYFDTNGARLKEMPWPSTIDWSVSNVIGDGEGVLLIEGGNSLGEPSQLVRLDRDGSIVWKTPKGSYLTAVSSGAEIVALVLDAEEQAATIVRLANP